MTKKEIQAEEVRTENNEEKPEEIKAPVVSTPNETTPEAPVEVAAPEEPPELANWVPKTSLGKAVMEGNVKSLEEIMESGKRIVEPEIIDKLLPGLKNELFLIGGRRGKGGGIERITCFTSYINIPASIKGYGIAIFRIIPTNKCACQKTT